MELTTTKKPTIAELYKNPELELKQEYFNSYLNSSPPANWIKVHPYIKNYKYLPIDKIEFLLRKFFKQYRIEVIKTGLLFNAIEVTVRVHYLDPITNEWQFHDGVGAEELQTTSGSGTLKMDMSNVNKGAVKMALPLAKSVAVKDACDHFGNIFGANLNRKDTLEFSVDQNLENVALSKEEERVRMLIERAEDTATLEKLKTHLTSQLQETYDKKWKNLEK